MDIPRPPSPKTPLPATPPAEQRPTEQTPSNGWDLLDDYQVGKSVSDDHELQTRRFSAPALPPSPEPGALVPVTRHETTTTVRSVRFWRNDGSAENDAAVIAKIMGRQQQFDEDAQQAIDRAATAIAKDERDRIRERQRREVEEYLALQRSRESAARQFSTSLQNTLREAADVFLALGICPDHLEYLADIGAFCSWGGRLYEHSELFTLRDDKGQQIYTVGPGPDGESTVCYSPRERRWKLDQPVPAQTHLTPVERLLPVPRRHADGQLRRSAQRARTALMDEGSFMVYVVGNKIYSTSHLRAAHFLHSSATILDKVAAPASTVKAGTERVARSVTETIDAQRTTAMETVAEVVGTATDTVTRLISSTTKLFRRTPRP
jgi:hypothetical protein